MGKIRRGGFIFVTWIGDHGRHVHVYRDRKLILKWDLVDEFPIEGRAIRRVVRLVKELQEEGCL